MKSISGASETIITIIFLNYPACSFLGLKLFLSSDILQSCFEPSAVAVEESGGGGRSDSVMSLSR